jgi:putative oxidoreductase
MSKRYDASPLGRILIAAIFVSSGIQKLTSFDQTLGYMQANGITFLPGVMLVVAAAVEILGGLMLATGLMTRVAAAVLFLFLIPTTLIFHNFWALTGMERQTELVNLLKNLAIMGGLAYVGTFGAPTVSVDAVRKTRHTRDERPPRDHHRPVPGY